MSNFYIVDWENFATASRRYTGDIHNSTVVSLFMTHCLQLNFQLHTIGLVRTCRKVVSALLRGNWQDYYWQDASRCHSAIAELLVLQARCPSCRPTNSVKALKEGILNNNNNNKLGRKLADQLGDEREISFLFQRLSVLIQRYNAILLHNCFVKKEEK